ncbi:monofunctional biosynthetic peptidoglycan transglycosylase [Eoetvoesiella caeni]
MASSATRKTSPLKILGATFLLGVFAVLLYQFGLFVMVIWLSINNPSSSAFMKATLSELQATDPSARLEYKWVDYGQISTNLKRAVIASEDANFTDHEGVEWDAIRKAWKYNLRQAERGKSKMRGGSTITQQLAKNLFLSGARTYLRKGQELILAYMIEAVMSKQRILELYLNLAQWGTNTFGAQAAARHYYKTDAARLNSYQAAQLAAMLPNPDYYDRHRNTTYLRSRTATIVKRMRQVDAP